MKVRMRLGLFATLCLFGASTPAAVSEYPYIYRSPRSMGLGGVDLAIGGHPTSVFSNPAGLARLPDGWQFVPWAPSAGTTTRTYDFLRDLDTALSISDEDAQRQALFDVMDDYRGRNIHAQWSALSSVHWRGRYRDIPMAFTLTRLNSERFDAKPHQGFGTDGVLTVHARRLEGIVFGTAVETGDWHWGLAAKSIHRDRIADSYTPRELVEIARDNPDFEDLYSHGNAKSIDLGLQFSLDLPYLRQGRLGLVTQNLGGLDFGDAGWIPQTTSLGIAFHPPAPGPTSLTIGADYIDLFHDIDIDDDPIKRTRVGVRWQLFEHRRSALAYSMGLYQGAPTLGLIWRWRAVELAATTYAEEQGIYAGQDRERRYLLGFAIGIGDAADTGRIEPGSD
ncbi:hypothetical protein [Saccharospirillum salsuginis]|uniref:Uncharacterized protein n=1 Tax=Saccharospirillum salsuginis TaxID=418750 RepID=A0A918K2K2_9GAMM|nr:hypothetical protein [Saccharospirillum salsuginis]GGX44058.1 hypothetical protein GCM10007392_08530 [Saccharospirillum salsuginis]